MLSENSKKRVFLFFYFFLILLLRSQQECAPRNVVTECGADGQQELHCECVVKLVVKLVVSLVAIHVVAEFGEERQKSVDVVTLVVKHVVKM